MDWTQVYTIIGANLIMIMSMLGLTITLSLWARKEANGDRKQALELMREMKDEMKDFHGRLVALEVKRVK